MVAKTHGLTSHPLYSTWSNIKSRCYNPNSKDYVNYGGRGITVCDEWLNDFFEFYTWAVKAGWESGLTIERENVEQGYNPENCSWIPKADQSKNTRRTVYLTAFGETKSMKEWSKDDRCAVSYDTLKIRIRKFNFDPETAIASPVIRGGNAFKERPPL